MKHIQFALIAFTILGLGTTAFAAPPNQPDKQIASSQEKGQQIHVTVNGMVCDFCAQSLKKTFMKQKSVQAIDVSLEKKMVTINLKPGQQLDDATIKKTIADAGYDVEKIHRMPEMKAVKE